MIATSSPHAAQPTALHYMIDGRSHASDYVLKVERAGERSRLSSFSVDGQRSYEATLDGAFRTLSFHLVDQIARTDVEAKLLGSALQLRGRLKARPLALTVRLQRAPFLHHFNVQLQPFIVSGERRCVFLTLRPDTMKPVELEAVKEQIDLIPVEGLPARVWAVRIRPTGLFALFWSTQVYFRVDDGIFVLDEGEDLEGRPMVSRLIEG